MARGWDAAYGYFGVNPRYAMIAKRHMHEYGTTQDQLGAVAVAQRDWARDNPSAEMRERPLTLADYHASRWIAEPFHVHDCCLVSNGGACVIVTDAARARDRRKQPVAVLGYGAGTSRQRRARDVDAPAPRLAAPTAFSMAGLTASDVDVAELYDCYTFTVIVTLEDYGFCEKGEGGAFVESGATARGGSLPVNTGGGQLSSFYMWGMTPLVEAVTQLRGDGGGAKSTDAHVALVSGNGGILATHSCLLLGARVRLGDEQRRRLETAARVRRQDAAVLGGCATRSLRSATLHGCGAYRFPAAECCSACLASTLAWVEASGRGSVYSFVVVHHALDPYFAARTPYVVADVELVEGPHVTTTIVGASPSEIRIGDHVEVSFEAASEAIRLPVFRRTES